MTAAHAGVGTVAATYLYLGGNPFSPEILAPAVAAGVAYDYFYMNNLISNTASAGMDATKLGNIASSAQMMALGEAAVIAAGVAMLGFGIPAMESVVLGASAAAGIYGVAYLMPSMA